MVTWLARKAQTATIVVVLALACALPILLAQTNVANSSASLAGKTIVTAEGAWTITGLHTFSRSTSPPFAVNAGSAKVTNLDADKLDGQDGTYYQSASNINSGLLAVAYGGLATGTTPASGAIPIGNGTGYVITGITGGTGITVTPGTGTITIAATGTVVVLDRDVTATDVTNSAAETTVYSFSVPGGTLSTNRALRLSIVADYLNNSGSSRTFTIKLKYGATTVLTNASNLTANTSANRNGLYLVFELSALNATGAQAARGLIGYQANPLATSAGTMDALSTFEFGTNAGVAEDSTAAKTLSVTFQISGTETTSSIRCHTVMLELL